MKTNTAILLMGMLITVTSLLGQIQHDETHLKHQWTFNQGLVDHIGGLNGEIIAPAKIINNALNTHQGGYMLLPSAEIALNNYTELTVEIWFTPLAYANNGFSNLVYFGGTNGGSMGADYFMMAASRGDDKSRTSISCMEYSSPWAFENGVDGTEYDDGMLHHMLGILTNTTITMYLDGEWVGTDTLNSSNKLENISPSFAFLCASRYINDHTWLGEIHQLSIYDKAMDHAEAQSLYSRGTIPGSGLEANTNGIALDTQVNEFLLYVNSDIPDELITISYPPGITSTHDEFNMVPGGVQVSISWDMETLIDDYMFISNASEEIMLRIVTINDSQCYTPMYSDAVNLNSDPHMNNLRNFAGWGSKSLVDVISHPDGVYCGIRAIAVGDGHNSGSGSLDMLLDTKLKPNTSYHVKAMVKTFGGDFKMGLFGWAANESDLNFSFNTYGEWLPVEFTFVTGAELGWSVGMFWNNWDSNGVLSYIDNWEIYEIAAVEPMIYYLPQEIPLNSNFEVDVMTRELIYEDSIISYQFEVWYDSYRIEYSHHTIEGTLSANGVLDINANESGILRCAFMNEEPLTGSGTLIKFHFTAKEVGHTVLNFADFYYNTTRILNIEQGELFIYGNLRYGDVDDNFMIQAYDAALTLQYSVGKDPIPSIDQRPWEPWRFAVADVDGNEMITAYDAGLILKRVVYLIDYFPVEAGQHGATIPPAEEADLTVTREGNHLVFRSYGALTGLNLFIKSQPELLGTPVFNFNGMHTATNINETDYQIGMAMHTPPADHSIVMTIPVLSTLPDDFTIEMLVNNTEKTVRMGVVTETDRVADTSVRIYPNPASNYLVIETGQLRQEQLSLRILNLLGQTIFSMPINSTSITLPLNNLMMNGVYHIQLLNDQQEIRYTQKFIKQ